MPKIVMIGAGSIVFTRRLFIDTISRPELQDSSFVMVDINEEKLAAIESDELDLVIGSRFLGVGDYQMDVLRRTGRAVLQALIRAFGLRISDPTSGFQALGRRVLDLYVRDSFPSDYPDVDVLLVAHRHGLRIGEHAVAMAKSERESTLHGGLAPVYYAYKMLLSLWAASSHPRSGATWEGTR